MSVENLTSVVTDPCHATDPGARWAAASARVASTSAVTKRVVTRA